MLHPSNDRTRHILVLLALLEFDYWKCPRFIYTNAINHKCIITHDTMPQVFIFFIPIRSVSQAFKIFHAFFIL